MNPLDLQNPPSYVPENQSGQVFHSEPPVCSRRALRKVLNHALAIPSQVDAFLIDFYPAVYQQTSSAMDRECKLNLLLSHVSTAQLTRTLRQEYPQALTQAEAQCVHLGAEPNIGEDPRISYTIVLSATISELDVHKVYALVNHLRRYTADSELTIEQIRSGSVIITCAGSERGYQRLFTDFSAGELSALLGYRITNLGLGVDPIPVGLRPGLLPPSEQWSTVIVGGAGAACLRSADKSLDEPTLLIKRPLSRTRLQVLTSLGAAASIAIVALVGGTNTVYRRSSLPEAAKMARKYQMDSPELPSLASMSAPLPNPNANAMLESNSKAALPRALNHRMARPVAKFSAPQADQRFLIDVQCPDLGSCDSPQIRAAIHQCVGRRMPGSVDGSLTLYRVKAGYFVFHREGSAFGRESSVVTHCWEDVVTARYGKQVARWPPQVRISWKFNGGK